MAAPTRRNWRLRSGSARAARSSRLASSAFTLHLLPPEGTLLCRRGIPVPGIEAVVADGSSQSLISRYREPTCGNHSDRAHADRLARRSSDPFDQVQGWLDEARFGPSKRRLRSPHLPRKSSLRQARVRSSPPKRQSNLSFRHAYIVTDMSIARCAGSSCLLLYPICHILQGASGLQ